MAGFFGYFNQIGSRHVAELKRYVLGIAATEALRLRRLNLLGMLFFARIFPCWCVNYSLKGPIKHEGFENFDFKASKTSLT